MKLIKCLTYVLCLVAVLVTVSAAQTNLSSDQIRQRRSELQRVLGAFADWAKRYASKTRGEPTRQVVEEGLVLAKERRAALKKLIEIDPASALSASIGQSAQSKLPVQVQTELETEVSGTGDLLVLCAMPALGSRDGGGIQRTVHLNGKSYRAAVYGWRASQTSKYNIPLHGIVVDDVLALDEHVLAGVTPEEAANSTDTIVDLRPSSGLPSAGGESVIARMGGKLYRFASAEHLRQSEVLLEEAESGPGENLDEPAAAVLENPQARDRALKAAHRPQIAPVAGATDYKVLVIRVDFSDLPGPPYPPGYNGSFPYTTSTLQTVTDEQVAPFYQQSSYGKVTLHFTITPKVYRLPMPAAYYSTLGYSQVPWLDATTVAGTDYVMNNFDKVIVLFSQLSNLQYGGLSGVGGSWVCVNGEFDFRVVAHELGHTFGLWHASFWQTSDGNPNSSDGSSYSYRDEFDVMGHNNEYGSRADFNPWFKNRLNWIQDNQVQTVTQNGIYRVYRFDNGDATGTLALKIARNAGQNTGDYYWIGYRRNFPENAGLAHGAYVIWGWPSISMDSDVLGLGPKVNDYYNPGLPVGGILADAAAGLSITPVAEGGIAPHEYLDVQVTFAPPPLIARQPNSEVALTGESAEFTVEAGSDCGYAWQMQASGTQDWVMLSDGNGYSGTSTPTLQIATTAMMNGDAFRCVLTNSDGGINGTRPVVLTVNEFGVATLAGQAGVRGNADGMGSLALFGYPMGIAVDRAGNRYIADTGNHTIRKVSPTGIVSTLAGLAGVAGNVDGVGTEARFDMPVGIAVDSAGVVYVVDQFDSAIRRITPDGTVTTLQVASAVAANTSAIAPNPGLNHPNGIAVDCVGNLYITDTGNNTIRKIAPDSSLSTLAGVNGAPGAADGQGAAARFNSPFGIAVDLDGNVYVADQGNSTIRKITPDGMVSTIAGIAGNPGSTNGIGVAEQFSYPAGLAVDAAGNLYVADRNNSIIRKIDCAGNVSTLAGVAGSQGSSDGSLTDALFGFPVGLAVDLSGVVYVADSDANTIRMIRTAAPQPSMLRIKIVAGMVKVSWPASAAGLILEWRSDLSPNGSWAPVQITPVVEGCNVVVTTTLQTPAAFFRLQHP